MSMQNPLEINRRRLPKMKFSKTDDLKLRELVEKYGQEDWIKISTEMGDKNPRQCRDRWVSYLNPSINRDPWTYEEDELLIQTVEEIGTKWVKISALFPGRTDAQCKNRYQRIQRNFSRHGQKVTPINLTLPDLDCSSQSVVFEPCALEDEPTSFLFDSEPTSLNLFPDLIPPQW